MAREKKFVKIIDGIPHVKSEYATIEGGEVKVKEYWIPKTELNGDDEEYEFVNVDEE